MQSESEAEYQEMYNKTCLSEEGDLELEQLYVVGVSRWTRKRMEQTCYPTVELLS
jgi:hypothetical protein